MKTIVFAAAALLSIGCAHAETGFPDSWRMEWHQTIRDSVARSARYGSMRFEVPAGSYVLINANKRDERYAIGFDYDYTSGPGRTPYLMIETAAVDWSVVLTCRSKPVMLHSETTCSRD